MPPDSDVPHTSAAGLPEHVAAPIDVDAAAQALKHGARGAFLVAGATSHKNNLAPIVRLAAFRHLVVRHVTALVLCCAAGVIEPASAAGLAANVDAARITGADRDPANWMTYGRTYSEQRFSPLSRITAENAKQLGLAWYADLDSNRGQEATPLVIDGVMYVSTAWRWQIPGRNPFALQWQSECVGRWPGHRQIDHH